LQPKEPAAPEPEPEPMEEPEEEGSAESEVGRYLCVAVFSVVVGSFHVQCAVY